MNSISTVPTVDRVPLEILQEIFLLACDGRYRLVVESGNDLPTQHILIAVSRRWMSTASLPKLWSNISVQDGMPPSPSSSRHVALLTTALQHVGTASISCNINLNPIGAPSNAILELLPILISSSRQWVLLRVRGGRMVPHVFLPLYRNLPLLKSLRFNFGNGTEEALSHIFSEAPNLVDVDVKLGENGQGYTLPWPQLRRAKIRAYRPPLEYLQNLVQSPQLEFLQYSDFPHQVHAGPNASITLPSVKEVDVGSYQLLGLLVLPSLETATIRASHFKPFKQMVSTSGCRIRTLTVMTFSLFPPMADLEGHLPALTRLKLHADEQLGVMAMRSDRNVERMFKELGFLREKFLGLEELSISMSFREVWEREGLVRIIDLLWELVSARRRLRHITLHFVYGEHSVDASEHVPLLDIGRLDEIDSFRELKRVHAVGAPIVDLEILYQESSERMCLMDADPRLTVLLSSRRFF